MTNSIYLLPNTPLLLKEDEQIFPETKKVIGKIADDLQRNNITKIITIACGVSYHRKNFSPIVHQNYVIKFTDFGDLVTNIKAPLWWDAYHLIRKSVFSPPLEPTDHETVDYPHGIPLSYLLKRQQPSQPFELLCFNIPNQFPEDAYHQFGKTLASSLDSLNDRYAILGLGNLVITKNASLAKEVTEINNQLRDSLSEDAPDFHFDLKSEDISAPTIAPPYYCLKGFNPSSSFREISFENGIKTSLLTAQL